MHEQTCWHVFMLCQPRCSRTLMIDSLLGKLYFMVNTCPRLCSLLWLSPLSCYPQRFADRFLLGMPVNYRSLYRGSWSKCCWILLLRALINARFYLEEALVSIEQNMLLPFGQPALNPISLYPHNVHLTWEGLIIKGVPASRLDEVELRRHWCQSLDRK